MPRVSLYLVPAFQGLFFYQWLLWSYSQILRPQKLGVGPVTTVRVQLKTESNHQACLKWIGDYNVGTWTKLHSTTQKCSHGTIRIRWIWDVAILLIRVVLPRSIQSSDTQLKSFAAFHSSTRMTTLLLRDSVWILLELMNTKKVKIRLS